MDKYGIIFLFGGQHSEDNDIYILNLNILNEILQYKYDDRYSREELELFAKLNKLWTIKTETSILFFNQI